MVVVAEEAEVEEGRSTSRAGHWTAMEDRRASRVAVRGSDTCASSSLCVGVFFREGGEFNLRNPVSHSW